MLHKGEQMIYQVLFITLVSFFANTIGTISGFGVGTVMTPILLFFLPLPQTILLVCIIHLFHDIWKLCFFHYGIDWQLFKNFGLSSIIASAIGAMFVAQEQSMILYSLLGLLLIISVWIVVAVPTITIQNNVFNGLIGGTISGFFAGMFGVRGAVRSLFLVGMDLDKAVFIGTTGLISLCIDSVRLVVYIKDGLTLDTHLYWGIFLFIPASFFGAYTGKKIVDHASHERFRQYVLIFLLLAGIRFFMMPWIG